MMSDPTSDELDRLLQAARKGDYAAVVECLETVDCRAAVNQYGLTPLHAAVSGGNEKVIRLLVERKAEIDKPDRSGFTPLYVALSRNRPTCVELLLQLGASVGFSNQDGATALHVAAALGREEIAKMLIHSGADVNAKNNVGNTPAMAAVMAGRSKVLELLLETGKVDGGIKNESGQSLLDLAVANRSLPSALLSQLREVMSSDSRIPTGATAERRPSLGTQTESPLQTKGVSVQTREGAMEDATGPSPYLEQLAEHRRRIRKLERKLASAQDEVVRLRRVLERQGTSERDGGVCRRPAEVVEVPAVMPTMLSEYRLHILADIERRLEKMQAAGEILSATSTVSTTGFGPLWATIGAANQVNQHIGCTARTVKLVSRKQIFLILPDQDASAGLEGGKAVRIFPCSMNPLDSLRQWHDEGEVPENAVALSWATLLGKMKSRKGRVKVEAKVIGEDDRNAWWIMSANEFEPGTVSFCCMEEEYRSYYIRHNNDKIDACIEEVGSGGFKQAASFNLLLRSDCDPRVNRNGSSVLNLSVDRSILEDSQGPDKTVESPSGSTVEAEQESSIGGLLESGIVDDSPLRSRVGEIEEEEDGGGGRDDDTDVSTRSQKRTRDVRSVPKKTRGKVGNGEESTPEAKPSDPKRKRHDSLSAAMAELVVSGKVDRRGGGGADRGDGNRLSTDSVFGHEGRPLARPSEARDSVFDLTIDHDEAPDVSRIDPAPTSAVFEELEEVRRALSIALDRDLESQEEIKLLRKQLESARKSSKESRELKQLRKEFEKAKQGFERSEAEAREKIRTLKQELVLELEAKDEALNRTEALEEKLEEKQASEEEATCTIKSLKKELKQKTERLRALQQKPDDVATIGDDERVAELEQELEEAQRLQAESQDVIKALRTELEDGEDRMKKLREELEEAKEAAAEGTEALRDELEAAEEARNASQAAVVALEAELAEVKAKVIELQEEQEAADARWQEVQSEKQAREGEINELKRTLDSLERLPLELETTKTQRNKAEIAMFGLEAEIEALKERLEAKEREMKTMMAESVNGKEKGNVGKSPLAAVGTEKPAVSSNRRESREARSRLSLEMDEAVAGLLGFGGGLAAVPEGCPIAGDQSVDKYKQIIVELQEKVKKQDGWLDECEFDISKWEGRYRHEQEEHERTLRKYKEAKEALEKAEKERTELRAEAQRLSLQLERVSEEREAVEKAMKELEAAVAVNNVKPESRTTSTSTSMSMRSLMSYEQRFEALKVETAKLKQEAEAFESSKRVVETRAENAEKKVEFLKAQRNEFEDTLEKLMKQMDVISAERTRLLHELSLAQDELKALKTGIAGVSDYNTAIKEAMRDAQRSARSVHDRSAEGREDTPPECEKTKVGEFAVTGVTQEDREEEGPVRVAEKSPPQAPLQAAEVLQRSSPVIDTVRSAKGKPPGGDGALSPLSVRMSELGPIQNSNEEEQEDKENVAIETIVEEAAETEDVAKERSPLKPSNSQPKITPLNPGVTPSKIGKPRNPGVIPGATPLTMSKPHRVRQLAEAFTASACAAAQSPKKPVELFIKPRIKNPISFRALGRLDGKPNDH